MASLVTAAMVTGTPVSSERSFLTMRPLQTLSATSVSIERQI